MKKIIAFTVLTMCSASVLAKDGFSGRDLQTNDFYSYTESIGITKVKDLAASKDNTRVSLRGSLVKHNGGMHYIFKDDTGEINVSIMPSVWKGMRVNTDDMLEIEGVLDTDRKPISILVDEMYKVRK